MTVPKDTTVVKVFSILNSNALIGVRESNPETSAVSYRSSLQLQKVDTKKACGINHYVPNGISCKGAKRTVS